MSINPLISRVNPVKSPMTGKINDHARIVGRKYNEDIAIKSLLWSSEARFIAFIAVNTKYPS